LAFVFKPNQAKDKNNPQANQAPGQGPSLTTGQGSVISGQSAGGASPGGQKASSSGRFSNIQSFVKANDAAQLGQQVTGKIGEEKGKAVGQLQEAKSAVDKSAQATGEAVASAKARNAAVGQNLTGAYAAQGGPVSEEQFGQNVAGLKQNLGMQYQGVEDLGDQANLRAQAQNLSAMGQATQSASGRNALLNRFYGNPQYAAGQRTLDTVLLGSQRPKIQQAAAQASTFGGELDTARRAALAQIAQQRSGVTGQVEEARQAVEGQIGGAKGAISERAAQAQQIRDLLRKPEGEMQLQQDINQPSITGDARSDAALRQALSSGFMDQGQVDKFKALQGRAQNVGFNTRDLLGTTLLEGEETGEQLNARAASQQQASRLGQLQGLIGQQGAYNPYAYDPNAAEGRVGSREDEIMKALANTDYDFSKDYNTKQDTIATLARMGMINPGRAGLYATGQSLKLSNEKADPYLDKDKTGLARKAVQIGSLGQMGTKESSPLKYATAAHWADQIGTLSNEEYNKMMPYSNKVGEAVSSGVSKLADLAKNKQAQRAQAALMSSGGSEIMRGMGSVFKKFCFAPNTQVQMADGSFIEIQDVKLGDHMASGGLVYSISSHLIDESQVYSYNGIIVTADHAVQENGRWLRVKDSRVAIHTPGATSVVYSLSNNGHRIVTESATFADYDEVDNPEGLNDHQCLKILNRSK
jgi:hypothetical protein